MGTPIRNCAHCNNPAGTGNFHSFSSNLRQCSDTLVSEAIDVLLLRTGAIPYSTLPIRSGICTNCYNKLSSAYKLFCEFKGLQDDDSCLAVKIKSMRLDCRGDPSPCSTASTQVTPKRVKHVSTPISKKLRKSAGTQKGRKAVSQFIKVRLRNETIHFMKNTLLKKQIEANDDFDLMPALFEELKTFAPNILNVLQAIGSRPNGKSDEPLSLSTGIGVAFCVLVMARNRLCNRFQKLIGLMLCSTAATKETYGLFNRMCISTSYNATMECAKILGKNHDAKMIAWSEATAVRLQLYNSRHVMSMKKHSLALSPQPCLTPLSHDVRTSSGRGCHKRLRFDDDMAAGHVAMDTSANEMDTNGHIDAMEICTESDSEIVEEIRSAQIVFDNINLTVQPKQSFSGGKTQQYAGVVVAAIFNRVAQPITNYFSVDTTKAIDVPDSAFLFSKEEEALLRNEQRFLIRKCICDNLQFFKEVENNIQKFIPHPLWDVSCTASRTESHGVINENENERAGITNILKSVQKYIPRIESADASEGASCKKPIGFIVRGDGLTIKRITSAQENLGVQETRSEKLSEFFPAFGQWHLRVLLLEKYKSQFFKNEHLTSGTGTLPYMKAKYSHTQVKQKVNKSVNPTINLFRFTWESYVSAAACQILGITSVSAMPTSIEFDKTQELERITEQVLDMQWHNLLKAVSQNRYCYCNRTYEQTSEDCKLIPELMDWISCENRECPVEWYHQFCVHKHRKGFEVERVMDSDEEKEANQETDEESSGEEDNEVVARELVEENTPPVQLSHKRAKAWYCSEACKSTGGDRIYNYSKGLIFTGLKMEGFRDAIRCNDAKRILMHIKLSLMHLSNGRHPTYFRILVEHLANVGGHAPKHIIHDLLHNSTVNVQGRPRGNIEADLFNEFEVGMNKASLKTIRGKVTSTLIENKTRRIGTINEIKERAAKEITNSDGHKVRSKDLTKWRADMDSSVCNIIKSKLLVKMKSRNHNGFKNFHMNDHYVDNVVKFKDAIRRICEHIDDSDEMNRYDAPKI